MDTDLQTLYDAAIQLPEGERLALATRLMESVPPDEATLALDDPGLVAELDRRAADGDPGIPWSQLKAEG